MHLQSFLEFWYEKSDSTINKSICFCSKRNRIQRDKVQYLPGSGGGGRIPGQFSSSEPSAQSLFRLQTEDLGTQSSPSTHLNWLPEHLMG